MATPLRKKRNYKSIQIGNTPPVSPATRTQAPSLPPAKPLPPPPPGGPPSASALDSPAAEERQPWTRAAPSVPIVREPGPAPSPPQPTRAAPAAKRRPPPMTLNAPKLPPSTMNATVQNLRASSSSSSLSNELVLDTSPAPTPAPVTLAAPAAKGKKRPPPMTLAAPKLPPSTMNANISVASAADEVVLDVPYDGHAAAPAPLPPPPAKAGKKRPPAMTLAAPKLPPSTLNVEASTEEDVLLTVPQATSTSAPNTSLGSGGGALFDDTPASTQRSNYHATLSNTLANLTMKDKEQLPEVSPKMPGDFTSGDAPTESFSTATSIQEKRAILFAEDNLKNEDLEELSELGAGNGGSVKKVRHTPSGITMAKKIVLIDAKPSVRKQILRELQIMYNCNSNKIVSFWGAYIADPNICICIELMDKGSLDGIYKKIGPIDIDIVGQVAVSVLEGLVYLYDVHRIIHRDIKPSNILANSEGHIKICDFGVSGELINSIADTFVGTSTYMSPERIQGAQYTVKSDVWSLGISLIELARGQFPFAAEPEDDSDLSDLEEELEAFYQNNSEFEETLGPRNPPSLPPRKPKMDKKKADKRKSKGVSLQGGGMTMSILELLQHIVNEPAPRLSAKEINKRVSKRESLFPPTGGKGNRASRRISIYGNALFEASEYPEAAEKFVALCLLKDPAQRLSPQELLVDPWVEQVRASAVDVKEWAATF